jgi:HAD superfamily hydrolase (TIGR01509 family)
MIKAIAFDIDGVLVNTKELHEIAFLNTLQEFGVNISKEYHKNHLDGLPTKTKLNLLNITNQEAIFKRKQELTFQLAENYLKPNPTLQSLFYQLKTQKLLIGIASNAIRKFCELTLNKLGLYPDYLISNEDAKPKPDPDMYLKLMKKFTVTPNEMIVFEDSFFGLQSAFSSKANVCYIKNPNYLTMDRVQIYLQILGRA